MGVIFGHFPTSGTLSMLCHAKPNVYAEAFHGHLCFFAFQNESLNDPNGRAVDSSLLVRGPYKIMRVEKHGWERGYPARSLVVIGGGGPRVPAPERRLAGGPDGVRTCAPGGGTRLGLTV